MKIFGKKLIGSNPGSEVFGEFLIIFFRSGVLASELECSKKGLGLVKPVSFSPYESLWCREGGAQQILNKPIDSYRPNVFTQNRDPRTNLKFPLSNIFSQLLSNVQ